MNAAKLAAMARTRDWLLIVVFAGLGYGDCIERPPQGSATQALVQLRGRSDPIAEHRFMVDQLKRAVASNTAGSPGFLSWRAGPLNATNAQQRLGEFETTRLRTKRNLAKPAFGQAYASTYINSVADEHIRACEVLNAAVVKTELQRGQRDVVNFPPGSIAVKAIWRLVPPAGVRLGLWRKSAGDARAASRFPLAFAESEWGNSVVVMPSGANRVSPSAPMIKPGSVITTDSFFSLQVTPQQASTIRGEDGSHPPQDSLMILVGLHVASKDTPDWLWATYWWSDQPTMSELPAPWNHFASEMALSMLKSNAAALRVFNPYLEVGTDGGLWTNCMTCHVAAGYCANVPVPRKNGDSITFAGAQSRLRTDYLWSVGRTLIREDARCKSQ